MCNLEIPVGPNGLCQFLKSLMAKHQTEYIQVKVDDGLKTRYKAITNEIKERAEYELSVILKKGYETYILIVADFVNWATSSGITVGPGKRL